MKPTTTDQNGHSVHCGRKEEDEEVIRRGSAEKTLASAFWRAPGLLILLIHRHHFIHMRLELFNPRLT